MNFYCGKISHDFQPSSLAYCTLSSVWVDVIDDLAAIFLPLSASTLINIVTPRIVEISADCAKSFHVPDLKLKLSTWHGLTLALFAFAEKYTEKQQTAQHKQFKSMKMNFRAVGETPRSFAIAKDATCCGGGESVSFVVSLKIWLTIDVVEPWNCYFSFFTVNQQQCWLELKSLFSFFSLPTSEINIFFFR